VNSPPVLSAPSLLLGCCSPLAKVLLLAKLVQLFPP
jgi:hypothetical protein